MVQRETKRKPYHFEVPKFTDPKSTKSKPQDRVSILGTYDPQPLNWSGSQLMSLRQAALDPAVVALTKESGAREGQKDAKGRPKGKIRVGWVGGRWVGGLRGNLVICMGTLLSW